MAQGGRGQEGAARRRESQTAIHDQAIALITSTENFQDLYLTPGKIGQYLATKMAWARQVWNQRPKKIIKLPGPVRNWQMVVLRLVDSAPPPRHNLIQVCGPIGGEGKTVWASWLVANRDAVLLPYESKKEAAFLYNGEKIIVLNIPRMGMSLVDYDLLEPLLDGKIISTKYEPAVKTCKDFNQPWVLILTNTLIDQAKLSPDRFEPEYAKFTLDYVHTEHYRGTDGPEHEIIYHQVNFTGLMPEIKEQSKEEERPPSAGPANASSSDEDEGMTAPPALRRRGAGIRLHRSQTHGPIIIETDSEDENQNSTQEFEDNWHVPATPDHSSLDSIDL